MIIITGTKGSLEEPKLRSKEILRPAWGQVVGTGPDDACCLRVHYGGDVNAS